MQHLLKYIILIALIMSGLIVTMGCILGSLYVKENNYPPYIQEWGIIFVTAIFLSLTGLWAVLSQKGNNGQYNENSKNRTVNKKKRPIEQSTT